MGIICSYSAVAAAALDGLPAVAQQLHGLCEEDVTDADSHAHPAQLQNQSLPAVTAPRFEGPDSGVNT